MTKRGQIALLLVILVIISIALSIYFLSSKQFREVEIQKDTQKIVDPGIDIDQLQLYGDACTSRIIEDDLATIYQIRHTFRDENVFPPSEKNLIPLFNHQLNESIVINFIDNCFNLPFFSTLGYAFTFPTNKKQEVSIGPSRIFSRADYRIEANFKANKRLLTHFHSYIDNPFGVILNVSQLLINSAYNKRYGIPVVEVINLSDPMSFTCNQDVHRNETINITTFSDHYVRVAYNSTNNSIGLVFNYTWPEGMGGEKAFTWYGHCP